MKKVKTYKDLEVWWKAKGMVLSVYKVLNSLPSFERFDLASQIRRSAISVPSNIAEGQGRRSTKSFIYHLKISYGSLMELETQLIIAHELHYITETQLALLTKLTQEVGRMINSLQNSLDLNPIPKSYPTSRIKTGI